MNTKTTAAVSNEEHQFNLSVASDYLTNLTKRIGRFTKNAAKEESKKLARLLEFYSSNSFAVKKLTAMKDRIDNLIPTLPEEQEKVKGKKTQKPEELVTLATEQLAAGKTKKFKKTIDRLAKLNQNQAALAIQSLATANAESVKPEAVVPAKVATASALEVDGVEIDENDLKAVRLARAAFPLVAHLYEVLKTGGEFVPSKIYEAGEGCAKMFAGEDGAEVLAISMIPGVLEMMRLMDVEGEDTVASVHAIVDQLDAARDAWVAASVRSLQSKAEAAAPVEPAGATEKARQVNQQVGSRRRGK